VQRRTDVEDRQMKLEGYGTAKRYFISGRWKRYGVESGDKAVGLWVFRWLMSGFWLAAPQAPPATPPLPSGERAGVRGRVRDAKGRPKGAGLAAGETERQRTPKQPDPEQSEGARQKKLKLIIPQD
jgi:hypothetical protein